LKSVWPRGLGAAMVLSIGISFSLTAAVSTTDRALT
jgi:hypothetical protein